MGVAWPVAGPLPAQLCASLTPASAARPAPLAWGSASALILSLGFACGHALPRGVEDPGLQWAGLPPSRLRARSLRSHPAHTPRVWPSRPWLVGAGVIPPQSPCTLLGPPAAAPGRGWSASTCHRAGRVTTSGSSLEVLCRLSRSHRRPGWALLVPSQQPLWTLLRPISPCPHSDWPSGWLLALAWGLGAQLCRGMV